MRKLKTVFRKCFGFDVPDLMLPSSPVQAVGPNPERRLLLASAEAVMGPDLDEALTEYELETAVDGHYLIGFWGYGVNSYAFYYQRVDSRRRVFFRLPYGGVYMDNDEMAHDIRAFLQAYVEFEQTCSARLRSLLAVDSMGFGLYEVVGVDGTTVRVEESLLRRPAFAEHFAPVLCCGAES